MVCSAALGVDALICTAYGNVGSSISCALGLVAALAAGLLTDLVIAIGTVAVECVAEERRTPLGVSP